MSFRVSEKISALLKDLLIAAPMLPASTKKIAMGAAPYEDDHVLCCPVYQEEIAADMALAMIRPVALQGVIQPFRIGRSFIANQMHHHEL
ncbi:hypothetical protein M2360_000352 [Rhizobium sp. SG_E_25_P2]|jgi:hypothetical protein|nr:hypothetical protein [Rhizobium sp. SG_E_25_P2]